MKGPVLAYVESRETRSKASSFTFSAPRGPLSMVIVVLILRYGRHVFFDTAWLFSCACRFYDITVSATGNIQQAV